MDSAEAASSSQKQGQVENTDAAKLDRALDQLAHEQANVQRWKRNVARWKRNTLKI